MSLNSTGEYHWLVRAARARIAGVARAGGMALVLLNGHQLPLVVCCCGPVICGMACCICVLACWNWAFICC